MSNMESLVTKTEQIKIADDCCFGENLEHQHYFLNDLEEKFKKILKILGAVIFWAKEQ